MDLSIYLLCRSGLFEILESNLNHKCINNCYVDYSTHLSNSITSLGLELNQSGI